MWPKLFALTLIAVSLWSCSSNSAETATCSVDISSESTTGGVGIRQPSYGSDKVAQSVTFTADTSFSSLQLKLKRVGSPVGTLTLVIETNSASAPSGLAVYMADGSDNSATFDAAAVSSTASTFYTFTFASAVTLQANSTYWVTVEASYNPSSTDVVKWMSNTANAYSSGNSIARDTATGVWSTSANTDLANVDLLTKASCE